MIEYHENDMPSPDRIISLYDACGWDAYAKNKAKTKKAFEQSDYLACAYEDTRLLGLVRCVTDDAYVVFVQDLLVLPSRRREGIATHLMQMMRECFAEQRIVLLTDHGDAAANAFYNHLGFKNVDHTGLRAYVLMPGKDSREDGDGDE